MTALGILALAACYGVGYAAGRWTERRYTGRVIGQRLRERADETWDDLTVRPEQNKWVGYGTWTAGKLVGPFKPAKPARRKRR